MTSFRLRIKGWFGDMRKFSFLYKYSSGRRRSFQLSGKLWLTMKNQTVRSSPASSLWNDRSRNRSANHVYLIQWAWDKSGCRKTDIFISDRQMSVCRHSHWTQSLMFRSMCKHNSFSGYRSITLCPNSGRPNRYSEQATKNLSPDCSRIEYQFIYSRRSIFNFFHIQIDHSEGASLARMFVLAAGRDQARGKAAVPKKGSSKGAFLLPIGKVCRNGFIWKFILAQVFPTVAHLDILDENRFRDIFILIVIRQVIKSFRLLG